MAPTAPYVVSESKRWKVQYGGGVTIAHRTGEWKVRGERSFVVRSVALSDKSGAINSKLAEEEGEGRKVLLSSLVG